MAASIAQGLIQDVQIGFDSPSRIAASAYGICDSAANNDVKSVEMTGFTIMTGVTVLVKFTNANTASNPRLQVSSTNAYPIMQYGQEAAGVQSLTTSWPAGAVVPFTFDGANWVMSFGVNTDTKYTVQNTYDGTSEDPISGKGVKAAIDTLDINEISNTASKTVATITEQDGKVGATFQNIEIAENQVTNLTNDLAAKAPINNPTFTGTVTLPGTTPQSDNEAVSKGYVDSMTAGLSGAMHYKDAPDARFTVTENTPTQADPNPLPTVTQTGILPANYTPAAGDVIIYQHQEFLYTGSNWRLLGDEGSYALKTNQETVIKDVVLSNSLPTLTVDSNATIPVISSAGTAPSMTKQNVSVITASANSVTPTDVQVVNGTLKITPGSGATFTPGTATYISEWDAGSATSLGTGIKLNEAVVFDQGSGASFSTKTTATVVKP